jgi:hypothetical protein
MPTDTTVRVSVETHDLLEAAGSKNESFDHIIARLVKQQQDLAKYINEHIYQAPDGVFCVLFDDLLTFLGGKEVARRLLAMQIE